ncbi:E3 ubiquitin-protein ligase MYCBP2-like [Arctopsyche grandis]|uniref:E3 ubiquitin-protein ligase MYCBP2-like n=1 Tax=Arctopsyche grandis TaxID=121162 RepID=UPI00406D648F
MFGKKMNYPKRSLYRQHYHNLFIDIADLGRKELLAKKNRSREREDPPLVLANPSQFAAIATVRNAILNKWVTFFFTPIELTKDFEETNLKEKNCGCNSDVINIGLKPVLTLLKESRLCQPVLCSKALLTLLDVLNQLRPEELFDQPTQVLDNIFDILLTTSCVFGPNSSHPDDGANMAAVAASSLVALVLAKANTGQIFKAILTLLTSPRPLEDQKVFLPKICAQLQKSAQALVLGTTTFIDWITHGVPKSSIYDRFLVNEGLMTDSTPYSMCSDGVYLYILTSDGLYKIGNGYSNTVKGCIFVFNANFAKEPSGWIGVYQGKLFLKIPSKSRMLKLSKNSLEIIDEYHLDDNIISTNGMFYSDSQTLGVISSTNDGMSLKVIEIEPTLSKHFTITKDNTWQITEKRSYIIEGETYNDNQFYKNLKPTIFNNGDIKAEDVVEIAKGHSFTIIRLTNGKVYFTGLGSVLGNKNLKEDGPWSTLLFSPIEKHHLIKKMAVGHDGQHAVFITEKGSALFSGTSQWGEDGEVPKIGRQPKVIKSKLFTKLKGESIVSASCNYGTSALVTGKGHLYMFGKDACYCDSNGRLDLPNEHVIQVALGKAHIAVLTISGVVFTLGLNNRGQCGRFYEMNENGYQEELSHRQKRSRGRKFTSMKRSTKSNNVQLTENTSSTKSDDSYQLPPGPINLKEKVAQIACGLHHTVLLTKQGEVFTYGSNIFGQLGIGHTNPHKAIVKINVPPSKLIAAGSNHTVILTKIGEVYTWGYNNLGQLARKVDDGETLEAWAAEPGPVVQLGPTYGYKSVWVGASGDATFINVDKALINTHTLLNSTIASSQKNLMILPYLPGHSYSCIVINRENGACKSFGSNSQVNFVGNLGCLDPHYDVMWKYSTHPFVVQCFNILTVEAKNLKECSLFESSYVKETLDDPYLNQEIIMDRRSLSILSCELAIPKMGNCFITRYQLATHILACLDTFYTFHSQNLFLQSDVPTTRFYDEKNVKTAEVNRFLQYREEWHNDNEDGVDAIRFMSDCDLFLSGLMVYGGNGEYMAKAKLFDLGYGDSDLDKDGKLIAETEEVMYECNAGAKHAIRFDPPVAIKTHRWYVIWARVSGNVTEFGEEGLSVVPICGNNIYFGSSKMSTKGTNVNFGQIPSLLVHGVPPLKRSKADDKPDHVHLLTENFGTNISRQGLDSLQALLLWSWQKLKSEMWEVEPELMYDEPITKIRYFEHLEYINRSTLRLIKSYLNHIYPKKGKKKNEESEELVDAIFEIRQLLISILGYQLTAPIHELHELELIPKLNQIIHSVLTECGQTFQELFHIFYPTSYLKWEILCTLLSNIKDGICTQNVFFLSAVVASLSSCVNLNLVLPVFFQSESSKVALRNVMLAEKMAKPSIEEFTVDADNWHLTQTLEHLLELVMSPLIRALNGNVTANMMESSHETLVNSTCELLTRIVAELAFNAVGESNEDQPNLRGYIISTPNRFLEVNPTHTWNGTPDYPDVVCFSVDKPGISIIGVSIYSSPGKHKYQLEFHEMTITDGLRVSQWKCIEYAKGVIETGYFGDDTVEIKFPRPLPIKERCHYAFRLWNIGKPTRSGEKGLPSVKGPDGTIFVFRKCFLGVSSTSTYRGQIPSILYFRDSHLSLLSSTEGLVKFPPKHILKVANLIIKKCAHYLSIIRNKYTPEQIQNNQAINNAPCLTNLIPLTLAHLSQLTDPESCVSILQMVKELLPHTAAINQLNYSNPEIDNKLLMRNSAIHQWVESAHPYKQATVTNYRVTLPPSVSWMALEMDPRSGTAQPEDSLKIFVSRSYGWWSAYDEENPRSSMEFEEFEGSDNDSLIFKDIVYNSEYVPPEMTNKLPLIPVTGKMSNNKDDWPKKTIIVPGNEIFFSMETATDYLKDDNGNRFGFKCLVVGYEDFFPMVDSKPYLKSTTAFSVLEMELAYIGGLCAASLMNPTTLSYPDAIPSTSSADEIDPVMTPNFSQTNDIDDSENVILSKGFSLLNTPDINQALNGLLPFRSDSKEFVFLQDFISCSGNTAGARLARWLQPNPHVEISLCRIELPDSDFYCGIEVPVVIHVCDQNGQPLHASDLNVKISIARIESNPFLSNCENELASTDEATPPNSNICTQSTDSLCSAEKQHDTKHENIFQDHNDKMHSIPTTTSCSCNLSKELLVVKVYGFGKLCGMWVPQSPGLFSIQCFIDGQMKEPLIATVKKPLDGFVQQHKEPSMWPKKIRNFYADDSAGLRIRIQPSLQSEQIGLIPVGRSLTFDDVVINGDGLWLQLSEESVLKYCDEPTNGGEAWSLQYNDHIGKSLLFPNEKILSFWKKLPQETAEVPKHEYLIMFPTYVWTGHAPSSTVSFTIDAGETVTIEKMSTADGVIYGKLDKPAIKKLKIFEEPGKEYWIMCSPINTHCLTFISNANGTNNQSQEPQSDLLKNKKMSDIKKWDKMYGITSPHRYLPLEDSSINSDTGKFNQDNVDEKLMFDDSMTNLHDGMQFSDTENYRRAKKPSLPSENDPMDVSYLYTDDTSDAQLLAANELNVNKDTSTKNSTDSQKTSICTEEPRSPDAKIELESCPRESIPSIPIDKSAKDADNFNGGIGISLSRAKSFRAVFAAFLWHEGIVHDAMACASYLKFHPSLSKQGAPVVTRNIPNNPPPNVSQRHSVEVANAGYYLHIQESSLESLTRSALNANANRSRSKRNSNLAVSDVTVIKEEENTASKDSLPKSENDVVCVLPAALRSLLALWDSMSEILPQTPSMKRNNDKENIPETDKNPDHMKDDAVNDEPSDDLEKTRYKDMCCRYCNIFILQPYFISHLCDTHPGCSKETDIFCHNSEGEITLMQSGVCGQLIKDFTETRYTMCSPCHNKHMQKRSISITDLDSEIVDQSESDGEVNQTDNDLEDLLINHHSMTMKNAMFSLHMVSAAKKDNDPPNTSAESSSATGNSWPSVTSYQCLKSLFNADDVNTNSLEETMYNKKISSESSIPFNLNELNDNGNSPSTSDDFNPGPSTSGYNPRFHRSVSMGQDAFQMFPGSDSHKFIRPKTPLTSMSSLLCNPSPALQALVGLKVKQATSITLPMSSPLKVSKELIMSRPVMSFIAKQQNIAAIEQKMVNSVRVAVMRKYGLEAFNWMLRNVTHPICLHDLMWWFVDAMNQNSDIVTEKKPERADNSENENKPMKIFYPWKESLDKYGNNSHIKLRDMLYRFLLSVCELIPMMPPASPLLLQAVRTCALKFSSQDHLFLHRCGIIKTLSKILSHCEEGHNEEVPPKSPKLINTRVSILYSIGDNSNLCGILENPIMP